MARLNELVRNQEVPPPEGDGERTPRKEGAGPVSFKKLEGKPSVLSMEEQANLVLEADQCHARAEMELTPILGSIRQAQPFSLDGITQVVDGFVTSLTRGDRLLVKAISDERGGLVISNMVNTTIMAIKIGIGLQYSREDLMRLGVAAILHDVGMSLIPDDILHKQGPLSPEQRVLLKRHPEMGAAAIRRLGTEAEWIAELALQEHERSDGQGYPHGLRAAEIHEFAQVIGLADTFEALLHARPHRKRFLPHEAVRELVTKEKTAFPTRILKCLIQQFSVFPLGTHVRLNSGETAEVVNLNPQYPLRPVVKVYIDAGGVVLRQPRVHDLSKTALVHITEVIQDQHE